MSEKSNPMVHADQKNSEQLLVKRDMLKAIDFFVQLLQKQRAILERE